MEEEIDIIELFKRIKEGNAPKWIEVGGNKYKYYGEGYSLEYLYIDNDGDGWTRIESVDVDTKIKILDKPIIEELDTIVGDLENPTHNEMLLLNWIRNNRIKINELTKYINKEEK